MSIIIEPTGLLKKYCVSLRKEDDKIILSDTLEGQSLEVVCRDLGLPVEIISLFLVNGRNETKTYRIRAGDHVKCVAIIGGG